MALTQISPVLLPLDLARRLTDAAIAEVASVGVPYTVTVLDGAGNTVLQTRMDGAALASIETSAKLAFVPGGIPITNADGVVIGAIGAGGGTPDQDHQVATAGAAA